MVEYFNFYYFLYIAMALGLLLGLYFPLRGKSAGASRAALLGLLFLNFALHFLKLAFYPYREWMPLAIRTVTPENLCAVSAMVFPWFFLSKSDALRDYMFYMGMASGLGATFLPVDVIGRGAFEFETARFYFSHAVLWVAPLLMVVLRLHALDYKRIPRVPFLAYLLMCVIVANEVFLVGAGFASAGHLFSSEFRNSALIFGPLAEVGFLGAMFSALTPALFTVAPVGPGAGEPFYWPIVWLVVPSFVYFCAASALLALPFELGRARADAARLLGRLARARKGGGAPRPDRLA